MPKRGTFSAAQSYAAMHHVCTTKTPRCYHIPTSVSSPSEPSNLLRSPHNTTGFDRWLLQEIIFIPQRPIELSSQFSRFGSKGRPSALEEKHRNNPPLRGISKRSKPPQPSAIIRAGSRLAHHGKLAEVGPQRPRCSVLHSALHTDRNLRNQRSYVQHPLHLWLKCR